MAARQIAHREVHVESKADVQPVESAPASADVVLPFVSQSPSLLETAVQEGIQALEQALENASVEQMVGAEGESSILHFVCDYYSSKETNAVLKVFPREHLMKKDGLGETALHVACLRGDRETIEALLELMPVSALTEASSKGALPLHYLALGGAAEKEIIVRVMDSMPEEALLLKRADFRSTDRSLMHDASCGSKDVAELVLSRLGDESLRWKDGDGVTPLMLACQSACDETLEFLIDKASAESLGAPPQDRNLLLLLAERALTHDGFDSRRDPDAACRAFASLCDVLDLEAMDWSMGNPLMAKGEGHYGSGVYKLAVERLPRSALSTATREGVTPWHNAFQSPDPSGSSSFKQELLMQHLTMEERCKATASGCNVLHFAAASGKLHQVLDLVEPSCALQEDNKGKLPLAWLSKDLEAPEEKAAVAKLIRLTAPALATSSTCVVAATFESLQQNDRLLGMLLDTYPDGFLESLPETHWADGVSPLHSVASCERMRGCDQDVQRIKMLLKLFKAFVSTPDHMGMTPLWLAALAGKADMVRLLLPLNKRPLGEKVSVTLRNGLKEMSLAEAMVHFTKVDILAALLAHDPSLVTAANDDGQTLLQVVEADEELRQVKGLLQLLQPGVKAAV